MKQNVIKRASAALASASLVLGTVVVTLPLPAQAAGACPAVGQDIGCAAIITITDKGTTVTNTGQGPYDGSDDTLVGVVNNSKIPIKSISLTSGLSIFGFDGDGINTFGVPGNPRDTTGYGGPNAYFTNINGAQTAGTVNFITPLVKNGGTSYFSLESALNSAVSCADIINNSITTSLSGNNTEINGLFTPKLSPSLSQAATDCGFKTFNWRQTITNLPAPSPYRVAGSTTPVVAPPPVNDPPKGGWSYEGPGSDTYPYYYSLTLPASDPLSVAGHQTATGMSFFDAPSDSCLPGGNHGPLCGGKGAPAGSFIGFTTRLVGVNNDNSPTDLGIGFTWKSTFNGTTGGINTTRTTLHTDPGSGTGGITVTGIQNTTSYQYQGFSVQAIAPATQDVTIDIRPGHSDPAVINPKSQGKVAVAIRSTADFDAATVDPASIRFGPAGAHITRAQKVRQPGSKDHFDLLLFFKLRDTGISPGDTQACLTGQTFDGAPIQGCDTIVTKTGQMDNNDEN